MDELKPVNSSSPQFTRRLVSTDVQRGAGGLAMDPAKMSGRQMSSVDDQERQDDSAPTDREQVREAVQKLNDYVQSTQRSLRFDFDEEAGMSVITVTDKNTNEVIRQIPDEVAVKMARKLNTEDQLSLFTIKV